MTNDLKKKVDRAIRLLQSIKADEIELSYSGGKDSDVILELSKMAGISFRAIYKNTTIDPPGTIRHAKINGVEIIRPEKTFFELIRTSGFPTRRSRHCCSYLKEYKILDNSIQGIRRSESTKRAKRYKEPVICRFYRSKKNRVSVTLPILDWTDTDIEAFIKERNIQCHTLYYKNGRFDVKKRLGCMGCPLKSDNGLSDFKNNPNLVKAWINNGLIWWNNHPNAKSRKKFKNIYELFVHNVFFNSYEKFRLAIDGGLFENTDCKFFLEEYFGIKL